LSVIKFWFDLVFQRYLQLPTILADWFSLQSGAEG